MLGPTVHLHPPFHDSGTITTKGPGKILKAGGWRGILWDAVFLIWYSRYDHERTARTCTHTQIRREVGGASLRMRRGFLRGGGQKGRVLGEVNTFTVQAIFGRNCNKLSWNNQKKKGRHKRGGSWEEAIQKEPWGRLWGDVLAPTMSTLEFTVVWARKGSLHCGFWWPRDTSTFLCFIFHREGT